LKAILKKKQLMLLKAAEEKLMEKQANIDRNNMPPVPDAIANQNGVDHLKAPSSFDGVRNQ
jgi:hypothetical protein